MKVLWPHNFSPAKMGAGVFMFSAADGLRSLGVDVELHYLGNLRSPANLLRARRGVELRARDFDLVHAQFGSACSLVTSSVKSCPTVVSIRGNDWNVHSGTVSVLTAHTRLARLMTRLALPTYDLCVAASHRMAADLSGHFRGLRVAVLPSPINLERFQPMVRSHAREALGFRDNAERWVLFNSLRLDDPVKRYGLAARAVDLANQRLGNIRLRIASKIPHEDMPRFVAACDLILCTSETEGWPNSIKEALACNVPFVSTDISDLRDIARQEPTCMIADADPGALADAICRALALGPAPDLRRHVASMGLRETSATLLGFYQDLLERKGERRCAACSA